MKFLKFLPAWLGATLIAAAAGSIAQTQFNLAAIAALGAPVSLQTRLATTLQDLVHFAPVFGLIVAAGFLVALPVAAAILRRAAVRRGLLYAIAGGTAVLAAILLMNAMLPVTAIGASRSLAGTIALAAAGALGGWSFSRMAAAGVGRHVA